ncbi:MAG: hypothetical protein WKF30_09145 [Pyrinomonadaceae bacterium]
MDITDYRREFRDFHAARERENHLRHARSNARRTLASVHERYSDLWTTEAIANLRRALNETPPHLEIQRASLASLVGFASATFAHQRAQDVTDELNACEAQAKIDWRSTTLAALEAKRAIAQEPDAHLRRELDARRLGALGACTDLRIARIESEEESATLLGFGSYRELGSALTGADHSRLTLDAQAFLAQSRAAYATLLRHVIPPASSAASPPTYADYLFFSQVSTLRARLSPAVVFNSFGATLNSLGLRLEQQSNLTVERGDATQPGPDPACFAINPPQEVVLFIGHAQGALGLATLLHQGAKAQSYGWISRITAERYPELTHAVDCAAPDGYGCLFRTLLHEPLWLAEQANLPHQEAAWAAAAFAFLHAHEVRRACAALQCRLWQNENFDFRAERVRASFAEAFTSATNFVYHPDQYLMDMEHLIECEAKLRAWSFAAGLNEYLRTRYGRRWWASRRAADELVDLWSTGSRHKVEELSRMLGFAENNFELLTDELNVAAKRE